MEGTDQPLVTYCQGPIVYFFMNLCLLTSEVGIIRTNKPSYITVKPPWRLYDKMFHKIQSPELRDLVCIALDTALFQRVYLLWILDPL